MTKHENTHPPEKDDNPLYRAAVDGAVDALLGELVNNFGLTRLLPNIIDFGCNIGVWSRAFSRRGCEVVGVDSERMRPHFVADGARFLAVDLTERVLLSAFTDCDVAVCLEVAEHLPPEHADTLVDTLCLHGAVVVFSAAVPGQGGHEHLNEQPFEYWAIRFAEHGYSCSTEIRDLLPPDLPAYYRNNMAIFHREEAATA